MSRRSSSKSNSPKELIRSRFENQNITPVLKSIIDNIKEETNCIKFFTELTDVSNQRLLDKGITSIIYTKSTFNNIFDNIIKIVNDYKLIIKNINNCKSLFPISDPNSAFIRGAEGILKEYYNEQDSFIDIANKKLNGNC